MGLRHWAVAACACAWATSAAAQSDPRAGRPEAAAVANAYQAFAHTAALRTVDASANAAAAYDHAYWSYVYINFAWTSLFDGAVSGSVSKATYEYYLALAAQRAYQGYVAVYAAHLARPTLNSTNAFYAYFHSQAANFSAYATGAPPRASSLTAELQTLLDAHNARRAALGRTRLVVDSRLQASAAKHAAWMAANLTMSHSGAGGTTPLQRAVAEGYTGSAYAVGENVAFGYPDATSVFNAWMGSTGHKTNIERADFIHVGLAVATGSNGAKYWTVEFGYVR
jgi:uncharacterized protein YkwD